MRQVAPEDHAVAARLGDVLDDQPRQVLHHEDVVLLIEGQVRRRVLENRLLAEVVLDHLGHEVVDALVVRHAVARRVDDRHVARAVGVHQARHTDEALRIERQRVEVFVAQAAVDDADALRLAEVVAVIDLVVLHVKILIGGQRAARALGEVAVLEVRRIVAPRRQDHADARRADIVHRLAQHVGVVAVIHHAVVPEGLRADASAQLAGDQRIARAGGNAQVVLQDVPALVLRLHEVDARDVAVNARGRGHALALRQVALAGVEEFLREHAVRYDVLVRVDVLQEQIERIHALHEAAVQLLKLRLRDDAGNRVERKKLLVEGMVLVNAEFHAVAREQAVDRVRMIGQIPHVHSPCVVN